MRTTVLRLSDVHVSRDGATLLEEVDWEVLAGQRWVVLGPNGSGKTTLLGLASLYLHPSGGDVEVAGERLGRTDVRALRTRIGLASPAFGDLLRALLRAGRITHQGPIDAVLTSEHLSEAFAVTLRLERHDRRWSARTP